MKSDSPSRKDDRGIPIVNASSPSASNSSPTTTLRRKSRILAEDLDPNDEVQLCRVRVAEKYCITPDSAPQRPHVASMYHISPHRLTLSPKMHSDAWHEATMSKEQFKTKSPVLNMAPDKSIIAAPRRNMLLKRKLDDPQDQQLPTKILRPAKSQEYMELLKKTATEQDMDEANSDSWQEASTEPLSKIKSPVREELNQYPAKKTAQLPTQGKLQEPKSLDLQVQIELHKMTIDSTKEERTKTIEPQDKGTEDEKEEVDASKNAEKPTKEEEEARVAKEIEHLMTTVRGLPNYYKIINKIGEGTFSTVYKAQDLRRDLYNNEDWEPQLLNSAHHSFVSPASTPVREASASPPSPNNKVLSEFVALKRIYHTSSPRRIANEIEILRKLKGSKCISPLITAFRQQDQVFVVMPYIQHDDFRKTYYDMNMVDIKYYMKSLFTALEQLHKHKILHRDVKPNNFLYNCRKRTGYLIDFGLAETEEDSKALEEKVQKLAQSSKFNIFAQPNSSSSVLSNKPGSTVVASSHSVLAQLTNKENRAGSGATIASSLTNLTSAHASSASLSTTASTSTSAGATSGPRRIPGYIRNDPRMIIRANRAGTRGFRAPEVLMRVTYQTCAIDIWSAGVILLCFLTGRFPFFLANDESDALVELTQIFGYKEMKEAAAKYNRSFITNIFVSSNRHPWSKLCEALHKERIATWDPVDYQNALDLLNRCLDLDNTTRITAAEALEHNFLKISD